VKPEVFYKYTSSSTAEIILNGGSLRWSSPSVFNDLAEFQRMPRFEPSVSESHRLFPQALIDIASGKRPADLECLAPTTRMHLYLIQKMRQNGLSVGSLLKLFGDFKNSQADDKIDKALRDHFDSLDVQRARVLCLTATPYNEVMWGTYAENHYGCALGFSAALTDSPFHEARPVTYTNKPAIVGSGLDFLLYGDTPELRRKTLEAVCYTKKVVWSYEQEWRLITWRPNEVGISHGDYVFHPEELKTIVFGARAKQDFIETICAIAKDKYPMTKILKMTHNKGELEMID
tara:strand:- start:887 stop:1753 length:867 start_codon:yes stop_codon:yes gene_type:complete